MKSYNTPKRLVSLIQFDRSRLAAVILPIFNLLIRNEKKKTYSSTSTREYKIATQTTRTTTTAYEFIFELRKKPLNLKAHPYHDDAEIESDFKISCRFSRVLS